MCWMVLAYFEAAIPQCHLPPSLGNSKPAKPILSYVVHCPQLEKRSSLLAHAKNLSSHNCIVTARTASLGLSLCKVLLSCPSRSCRLLGLTELSHLILYRGLNQKDVSTAFNTNNFT